MQIRKFPLKIRWLITLWSSFIYFGRIKQFQSTISFIRCIHEVFLDFRSAEKIKESLSAFCLNRKYWYQTMFELKLLAMSCLEPKKKLENVKCHPLETERFVRCICSQIEFLSNSNWFVCFICWISLLSLCARIYFLFVSFSSWEISWPPSLPL